MPKISFLGGLTLLMVACLTIMVGCVIVPGLPAIAQQLQVANASGWLVTLPALGVVLFGPLTGKMTEKIGLHRTLCWGLLLYGFLGAGGAFLRGYLPLFFDRLLLGGATAMVMTSGTGLISQFYQGSLRLKMIALQGMSIELGGVIFLFIGGLLAGIYWASPFGLYLFAWFLLGLVLFCVPRATAEFAPAAGTTTHFRTSGAIRLTLFAALASMIIFFTAVILLPLYFSHQAISSSQTGMFLSFISLVAVCAAALMPRVSQKISEPRTLALAFACYGLGLGIFSVAPGIMWMLPGAVAMGFGFGLSIPLVNHLIVILSPVPLRGRYLARLSMAIFSGQFMASFMSYLPGSLPTIFAMVALLALVVGLCLLVTQSPWKKSILARPSR
ncbi:MFS transporter [Mangrovibacter yixingensis]|uniref:MFS transporter n=1 Tax=Mangrovibacter yixingensis TaxID=1529639 RepID=UPI001CFBFB34|nr:MFS transporter [Mangrovibacter yixingensis]